MTFDHSVSKDGGMFLEEKEQLVLQSQISPEKLLRDLFFVAYSLTFRRISFFCR
jgi:hypothetical protein